MIELDCLCCGIYVVLYLKLNGVEATFSAGKCIKITSTMYASAVVASLIRSIKGENNQDNSVWLDLTLTGLMECNQVQGTALMSSFFTTRIG